MDWYEAGKKAAEEGVPAEVAAGALRPSRVSLLAFLDGFGVRTNPGRQTLFDRCVQAVEARGGAKDPKAVCAAAGRRKYGQAEMTRRAVAGKRKAARGRKRNIGSERRRPPHLRLGSPTTRCGTCSWFDPDHHACNMFGAYPVKATQMCDEYERGEPGTKMNPADLAAAGFEEFHGYPSDEVVEVTERIHHHAHLSSAGKLGRLLIEPVKGRRFVELKNFDGAILAFNEAKNQLFIVGGDQSVNLREFGITSPHEVETLGQVEKIGYLTRKDHLGTEGGTALYLHKFRTTNEHGRHVTIKTTRRPDLIYYVLDERLVFSGGSYEIIPEGIDK